MYQYFSVLIPTLVGNFPLCHRKESSKIRLQSPSSFQCEADPSLLIYFPAINCHLFYLITFHRRALMKKKQDRWSHATHFALINRIVYQLHHRLHHIIITVYYYHHEALFHCRSPCCRRRGLSWRLCRWGGELVQSICCVWCRDVSADQAGRPDWSCSSLGMCVVASHYHPPPIILRLSNNEWFFLHLPLFFPLYTCLRRRLFVDCFTLSPTSYHTTSF